MSGRQRFQHALDGLAVAFAPRVWQRLPDVVRQPAARWWEDAATARRLLLDAAQLAGADAMFIGAARDAAAALRASGSAGDTALDELAETPAAHCGYELVAVLRESAPFAVIAALPDHAWLGRELEAGEPEVAEDALTDLARAYMDAGADALAVVGSDEEDVRAAAARAAGVGDFYGRPVLALCVTPSGATAWMQSGADAELAVMPESGEWPPLDSGVVVTAADVSLSWDAARLHAVGCAHP